MIVSRRLGLTALSGLAISSLTRAASGQGTTPTSVQPTSVPPQPEYNVQENLLESIESYIVNNGLRDRPGVMVDIGTANVPVPITHPDWINARVQTFNQAVIQAQVSAIRTLNSSIQNETVGRFFQAANLDPPPLQSGGALERPDLAADLARRILGVARGRLDAELRELGINPEDFNRQPEPVRHQQFLQAIRSRSVIRASASLSAYQPVATFEGHNGQGLYSIGVVLVGSQRLRDVAAQIAARRPFEPDSSRAGNPDELLRDPRLLIDDFGVRLLYDQQGLPVIFSFGQAGAPNVGNDSVSQQMARDGAERQAITLADVQIAAFIRASAEYREESEVGQQAERSALRMADGFINQQDAVVSFLNGRDETIRRRTDVQNLAGITTRRRWAQRHPIANQMIYGVVRSWSAAAEANARLIRDGRPPTPTATPAPVAPTGQGGIRAGRNMLNERDF